MTQGLFLCADIGTSSLKVCVFDQSGNILFSTKREYPTLSPAPGYAEQDPGEIFSALAGAVKEAVSSFPGSSFEALSFDTMLHSLLLVDGNFTPLAPLWNWMDTRSFQEVEEFRESYEKERLYELTAAPLHTIYHPSRILWFRKHHGGLWERVSKILSIKDWVLVQLTGELCCDCSTASGTGLLEVQRKAWSRKMCDLLGISPELLPPLVEPDFAAPLMNREFAASTGLPLGIPVVWGGGDGPFANLGEGCFREGEMVVSVGSSGAVRMCALRPVIDPGKRAWCYYLASDIWVGGGAINNGGIVFSWMRDLLREGEVTLDLSRRRPLFLPFLTGERSPYWDPYARGILFGLSFFHTPEALLQAAYESVAFSIRAVFDMLREVMGEPRKVVIGGGFALSENGKRVLCDVLGVPVAVSSYPSSSAKGAFLVALKALGYVRSFEEFPEEFFPTEGQVTPDANAHALYEKLFRLFKRLYEVNAPLFREFAKLGLA
ncbi:gluconokinase [Candidatus Caldatribacterium saccharofermentans]|uniref:gluconokinase n=1 Tax=Candidatus Caldatribacterium saccharofermentans TaxID=1454753 RepID=UPI003CFC983B